MIKCICTPRQYNIIQMYEGKNGRTKISLPMPLTHYTIGNDGKPLWWGNLTCEICGSTAFRNHKTLRVSTMCRSCANSIRNKKWEIKQQSIYRRWHRMWDRCQNPNSDKYERYGGRGISVCDEWMDFHTFQDWCLTFDYPKEDSPEYLEIHRTNNDGNYTPNNCALLSTTEHARLTHEHRNN